ncbi:MAG: biotin--[acetyl-CoA-carboxylase] ligase [Cryomorphaceae bacterium]|nr:biotin--[acetyl-CoA-carboxylase] ligase [Cryomorphaceae bacterium]
MHKSPNIPTHRFSECESTNAEAQKYIMSNSCEDFRVFISSHQSLGRGQADAIWYDKPNTNALFSVILPVDAMPLRQLPHFNMFLSATLCKTLSKLSGQKIAIKWPNDLMFNKKKIGGILIETSILGGFVKHLIMGIGINLNYAPETLPHTDVLKHKDGHVIEIDELIFDVAGQLQNALSQFKKIPTEKVEADYHKILLGTSGWWYFKLPNAQPEKARIIRVDEAGSLHLKWKASGKVERYRNKEVAWCYEENLDPN